MFRHWNGQLGETVESPTLEVFKRRVHMALKDISGELYDLSNLNNSTLVLHLVDHTAKYNQHQFTPYSFPLNPIQEENSIYFSVHWSYSDITVQTS